MTVIVIVGIVILTLLSLVILRDNEYVHTKNEQQEIEITNLKRENKLLLEILEDVNKKNGMEYNEKI